MGSHYVHGPLYVHGHCIYTNIGAFISMQSAAGYPDATPDQVYPQSEETGAL